MTGKCRLSTISFKELKKKREVREREERRPYRFKQFDDKKLKHALNDFK